MALTISKARVCLDLLAALAFIISASPATSRMPSTLDATSGAAFISTNFSGS